ncbi:MAG: TonB-dependent receptor, partial [Acidobacteriaceae bacterium]
GGILGNLPRTSRQLIVFPKMDWRVNNRIHLIGEYNRMRRNSPNGMLSGASATYGMGSFGLSQTSEDAAVARLEYFFAPGLLSNARYQYSRDLLSQLAAAPTDFEQQFAANLYGHAPEISLDRSSGFALGTLTSEGKSEYPLETRQQFVDSVTWIHGRHAFRFGYDFNHVTDKVNGVANQNGEYSYASFANFVADLLAPDSCDGTTTGAGDYPCYAWFRQTVGSSAWQFSTEDYAAFAEDNWSLSPRFILSLGLRYDYERLPNTNKLVVNPDIPQTAHLPHDRNNFGPRAGFAWDIFGSGHTVLRGGYGLYYGRISNATVFSALTSTGSARSARSYFYRPLDGGAPQFPFVFAPTETPYTDPYAGDQLRAQPGAVYFDKRFQNPEIGQADLSLEQRLGRSSSITLSYMASFGRELPQFIHANIDHSAVATLYYTLDFRLNPQRLGPIQSNFSVPFYYQRLNPAYGPITEIVSESNSRYQGAVVRFTRRASRSISLNVAYTYSHAIDDNQNEATFASLSHVYDPANMSLERGTSNFDIRQRASGGVVAHVPWRINGFFGRLANGYMVSTLGEWRTGRPYTMRTVGGVPTPLCSNYDWLSAGGPDGGSNCLQDVTAAGGVITDGARPAPGLGPSLNGSGGQDLLPQVGRNTFRYPGAIGLDVRAAKRTSITDRIGMEFYAEAFNILNHPNVTNIQTVGYRLENQSKSGAYPNPNTVSLAYESGLKTESVVNADGQTQTQLIGSPVASFGEVTNTNSAGLYRDRKIQIGCRLSF